MNALKFKAILTGAVLMTTLTANAGTMSIEKTVFGKTTDSQTVHLYKLTNANGAVAEITNYGGIVVSLHVPDKSGKLGDVVFGYDNLEDYKKVTPYFGCLVGRYGNRIAKGKFTLDGQEYTLATNNGPNSLHGGIQGFDKVLWTARAKELPDGPGLELQYLSKDGEEGYPGNLMVTALYTWTNDNALRLEYTATSDKATVLNLTQHSYFNLKGKGPILDHSVMIDADRFTPVDETLIPTGVLQPVQGTPFDFTAPQTIGARIEADDEQLKFGGGYDHNWVLNKKPGELTRAARVTEATTGRVLEVFTTEPGLQFYVGNFLDGTITGKYGVVYEHRNAFCMEPQHFPDSPNQPNFPSTVLKPGQVYRNIIIYKFSTQ